MQYAVYCPAIPRLKIDVYVVGPAKTRSPRRRATSAEAHTALTGVSVRLLTRHMNRENGSAPSRAKAKVCLDAAVSCQIVSLWYHPEEVDTHEA